MFDCRPEVDEWFGINFENAFCLLEVNDVVKEGV